MRNALSTRFTPVVLLVVTSCGFDDTGPTTPEPARELFATYVALGNSITAGFQSGGINDSTQRQAYPILVAEAMGLTVGTDFVYPSFNPPGCPAPTLDIFTGERLGGTSEADCALRANSAPPHNLAVPGAAVIDALSNNDPRSRANPLTTLILGGSTQLTSVASHRPTFVTIWLGNNDVLTAALSGDTDALTLTDVFDFDYVALVDGIEATGVEGVVLIGVANVTNIPAFSSGAAYRDAFQAGRLPPGVTVAANCAGTGGVGVEVLVPFEYGFDTDTIDCESDPEILSAGEIGEIETAVAGYNTVIARQAAARGWGYLDPNRVLDSLKTEGEIPGFPTTEGSEARTNPFGTYFSRDGVHPSGAAHRLIAQHVIATINATYGTDLRLP